MTPPDEVEEPLAAPASLLDTAVRKIGVSTLRGAAVGVACGALPAACPAIMAIDHGAKLAEIASDVFRAYSAAPTRKEGLDRAADEASLIAFSEMIIKTIQDGSESEMRAVSGGVGTAVSVVASGPFHADSETIRVIAEETTYGAMRGAVSGVVPWSIERLGGSS